MLHARFVCRYCLKVVGSGDSGGGGGGGGGGYCLEVVVLQDVFRLLKGVFVVDPA